MAYADYRRTRVKRSEEERTEHSISHVRHLIKKMPERCLDTLGIFNKDDLRNSKLITVEEIAYEKETH